MNLWCLHGNLQLPTVWDLFTDQWKLPYPENTATPVSLITPNFWDDDAQSFTAWTTSFCEQVAEQSENKSNWLLGYSMGGRLALHAALHRPSLFRGVIVVGAHPGFPSIEQRQRQQIADAHWAKRFREDQWDDILRDWDTLPVFGGRPNISPRAESLFSREKLASGFENFSKAQQAYLTPALSSLTSPPILFVSGEDDEKYSDIGASLEEACTCISHVIIPNAGHRVPWENPTAFVKKIQVFLDNTS